MSNRQKIDGSGTSGSSIRTNLSQRSIDGKLAVERGKCPKCYHHKIFVGNNMGQNKIKCCKCKRPVR